MKKKQPSQKKAHLRWSSWTTPAETPITVRMIEQAIIIGLSGMLLYLISVIAEICPSITGQQTSHEAIRDHGMMRPSIMRT